MLRAAALATAATALVLGSASVAAAAQASAPPTWQPCGDVPTIGSATLRVPSTGETRHGATVELALARHNATDSSKRIGPLLVNPGGPGGSGVDFVKQADDPQGYGAGTFSADLRTGFAIVGWDPRSKAEADRFLSLVEADISQGRWIAPSAGRTRVAEWPEQWFAAAESGWPKTRHIYRSVLDREQLLDGGGAAGSPAIPRA